MEIVIAELEGFWNGFEGFKSKDGPAFGLPKAQNLPAVAP